MIIMLIKAYDYMFALLANKEIADKDILYLRKLATNQIYYLIDA